ncbi:hypothetical protein [Thiomicrospira sp.]|uniref:mevalonate kinase family protein n=1 Tax=Thiomicrospira sp. TaxID=935 RepID=UPI002F93C1A1
MPAKLILSGEHAVLYDAPALSMAINLTTESQLKFQPSTHQKIEIQLTDYGKHQAWSFSEAWDQAMEIEARFIAFEKGLQSIRKVCQQPFDLILLCLFHFEQHFKLQPGHWTINIQSNVWAGRGLGSSASVIVSLLSGLFKHHNIQNESALLALAQTVESRQHGQSSGLDPVSVMYGGLVRFQQHQALQNLPSHRFQAWLIDTGEPNSTTGECVSQVKAQHAQDKDLWQAFTECTNEIHKAWLAHDGAALKQAVRANQTLLEKIGVVPTKVAEFIQQLQQTPNCAAKVCGAGSISGDQAGVVMALCEQNPTDLCTQWGYTCQKIQIDQQGARCQTD